MINSSTFQESAVIRPMTPCGSIKGCFESHLIHGSFLPCQHPIVMIYYRLLKKVITGLPGYPHIYNYKAAAGRLFVARNFLKGV